MSERVLQFGPDAALSGVLNLTDEAAPGVALLLFNAGVVHRVGAHRLNVKLVRHLSAGGVPSLRFDLSGLGESPAARGGLGYEAQSIADIGAAIDVLKKETGAEKIIVLGMCSGADNGYRAALVSAEIDGLVLLDPYAYENRVAQTADFMTRAADPARWIRKAKNLTAGKSAKDISDVTSEGEDFEQARPIPPREEFGADLQKLTARGVDMLIIYTGFVRRFVSKPTHFFETFSDFDFAGRIDVKTMPHTDHTYTQLSAQRELFGHVSDWLAQR